MAVKLFHITSPKTAYLTLHSGMFTPKSIDPESSDACMSMLDCDFVSTPQPYINDLPRTARLQAMAQKPEGQGAALILEWSGPIESPSQDLRGLHPDILYHQNRAPYSQATLEEPHRYFRSMCWAGTRQYLTVRHVIVSRDALSVDYLKGRLPRGLMGLWRFMPRFLRRGVVKKVARAMERKLEAMIPAGGVPIGVAGANKDDEVAASSARAAHKKK